jgi:hypothetical protein
VFDTRGAPEVEGISVSDPICVPSVSIEPGPANEAVHEFPEPPQKVRRVPSVAAADPTDAAEHVFRRRFDFGFLPMYERGPAGPVKVAGDRVCIGLRGLDPSHRHLAERCVDRFATTEKPVRHQLSSAAIEADRSMLKAIGEGQGDVMAHRRHEMNPEGAHPRSHHRDR